MKPVTFLLLLLFLSFSHFAAAQPTLTVDIQARQQVIDGFGAFQGGSLTEESWWKNLYFNDLGASIYRVDLTPRLKAPYSDLSYYSPWFMGSATNSVFNIEDPDNPNGPENNRVRTYQGPSTYSRSFGGQNAPIAVMGPDIEQNILYFDFPADGAIPEGISQKSQLGDFKLIGSFWSPVPWVKVLSGNTYTQNWWPGPVSGTPWPFIWGGNFAGGRLDVSGNPVSVFNDLALGGTGPTSSLTQFARSCAAYVLGYQRHFNTRFYAISIQNELNFEQFYNSATYPLASQYILALKAIRTEFDKYPELADVRIMGPEDLLGTDAYGMWQYGSGNTAIHKNLQYLQQIGNDPDALAAIDFFCIHGYAPDGVSSAGANPQLWDWWANGWNASPAAGIPGSVQGFRSFNKKSWMTETSGENRLWLSPAGSFPNNGAWSLALKIHQALTTGQQSAWVHWSFVDVDNTGAVTDFGLTSQTAGANSPKFVAAKHFFKYIRPNSVRVNATPAGTTNLQASAYVHDTTGVLTLVLINTSNQTMNVQVQVPGALPGSHAFTAFTSKNNSYWVSSSLTLQNGTATVTVPGYGVTTLTGTGALTTSNDRFHTDGSVRLFAPAPNPVHEQLKAGFYVSTPGEGHLCLLDATGKEVAQLHSGPVLPGSHFSEISVSNLAAGMYLLRLRVNGYTTSQKVLIR